MVAAHDALTPSQIEVVFRPLYDKGVSSHHAAVQRSSDLLISHPLLGEGFEDGMKKCVTCTNLLAAKEALTTNWDAMKVPVV